MKKYFIILLLVLMGISAQSQILISLLLGDKVNSEKIEFGFEGGMNFSNISNMDSKKYANDWNLGYYFVIKIKNNWYVNTGMLVKAKLGTGSLNHKDLEMLGVSFPDTCLRDGGKYYQKINTFLVPMMVRYMFKNRIYVEAGAQAGLRYKSWIEYDYKSKEEKINLRKYNKDQTNPLDVGAIGGVGYRFEKRTGMTLGIKYYYGFVNAYKGIPGTKNNSLFLKLNIPIGAGEKAQKKKEAAARKKAEKKAAKSAKEK